MSGNLSAVFFVFFLPLACQQVLAVDHLHDAQEKQVSQAKKRLSLQSTGELLTADVPSLSHCGPA